MDSIGRFRQAVDYLKFKHIAETHEEMADSFGANRTNFTAAYNGNSRYFTNRFLNRFAAAYSDFINKDWLLTGEGQMLTLDKTMRPHYDTKVSAGFMDGISEGKMSAEFRAMAVPLKPYDFSIDVTGDSMLPRIEHGDVLMCRVSIDRLNPPIGKICVIDTKDGRVVKVIKSVNEDTMTLHSINPDYHDYEIEIDTILGVAEVVGLVRSFV